MNTTLKFPQDLLRFLYWVFFKPLALFENVRNIGIEINVPLISLRKSTAKVGRTEILPLLELTFFHAMITPAITVLVLLSILIINNFTISELGAILGVALGVFLGLLTCLLVSPRAGLVSSMASSVSLGIALGVSLGSGLRFSDTLTLAWIALCPAWSITSSVLLVPNQRFGAYVSLGLIFFSVISISTGLMVTMSSDVGLGMFIGIGWGLLCALIYFHVIPYVFEFPLQAILSFIARVTPDRAISLFRFSPINWDQTIGLPLWSLDTHLGVIGRHDRGKAQHLVVDVSQTLQQWAARNALIELTAYDVERAQNASAIANIAEQFAWLPPTMPKDLENVLPPIRDIAAYAQAALESDSLYNKQTQLRNAIAQTQRVRAGLALSSNRQIAARFGRALETWEQVLGKELRGLDAREVIPNVYVAGSPLATASKVFKGRHDLFVALERELASQAETRPTLLLFGARRSGKTSAIKQMPVRLGPDVIPVEVDLQSAATAEDARGLLFVLADQIKRNALTHRRVQLPALTRDDLRADPYIVFGDWLNRVEEAVGARWILLNLDEYEKLAQMIDDGRIDARVFDFLRGIIQHHPRVTVLLSGSHTLDDVGARDRVGAQLIAPLQTPLSDYLINVRVLRIENLKEDEARELICKPIDNFPLEYEPAAVERILAVTGCQPYLVQATCRDLVNALNEENRTRATLADADRALDSVLTTGIAYFQDLWGNARDSDDAQRAVMHAIATQKDVGAQLIAPLQNAALRKLVHRDILLPPLSQTGEGWGGGLPPLSQTGEGTGWGYRVELVRRWVERNV